MNYRIRCIINGVIELLICQQIRLVKEEVLDTALKDIGNKLAELRRKKGYTSHESFAYDHDIPRMHYWRIENGKTNITIRSLIRILAIHKMSLQEFFDLFDKTHTKI